jgi:hypothetical protein
MEEILRCAQNDNPRLLPRHPFVKGDYEENDRNGRMTGMEE